MPRSNRFIDFLLGSKKIESQSTFKRAVLRGQLSLLAIGVGAIYIVIDSANQLFVNIPFYIALIIISSFVWWLNRIGKYQVANITFLSALIVLIFFFAINDVHHTGVHTYFIVYTIIAIILCGYDHLKIGIFFSSMAVIFFVAAYWFNPPNVIPMETYTKEYINTSFTTNFTLSIIVTIALLYFLLEINFKSERKLSVNNQLLSKVNQELDRFVYSASHDLRAPLSSLLGLVEIAQLTHDPEEIKHCLKLMRTSVSDLDAFIKEIIDYSRNSRQDVKKEKFNILELTQEVVDGLKFGSGLENLFIQYNIPSDLIIETDRLRLKTILYNIIGNAFKYHDPLKSEQVVNVTTGYKNRMLNLLIEDNGLGIAKEHLPRIFEMFFRASEKSQGSGLGLYIVKETLDKLNGKVSVTSSPKIGTTFQIEMPA